MRERIEWLSDAAELARASGDGTLCPRCGSSNTVETGPAFRTRWSAGFRVELLCAACGKVFRTGVAW